MGNILGTMGAGEKIIAYDAHIDTVSVGNRRTGHLIRTRCLRRSPRSAAGASDQLGGMVSAVYGAKIMKDWDCWPATGYW